MNNNDWYPTLTLKIDPSGVLLRGDFDTGAAMTFVSYEWLVEQNLVKHTVNFTEGLVRTASGTSNLFQSITVELNASLVTKTGITSSASIRILAIRDWQNSPFARLSRSRIALIGRDILKHFQVTIEFDANANDATVTEETWSSFEIEVANLFRALGLKVQRNYNLEGNQIDVFLTEETASGKQLKTIVECKFHQGPVGIQYVRQLSSILDFAKSKGLADHAILVASAGFTKDAYLVGEAAKIQLMEIDDLRAKVPPGTVAKPTPTSKPEPVSSHPKQRTAFVIMPFKEEFRDIYMLGIREILDRYHFVCRRADEVQFNGRIMDQILDLITTSDIVIAEVSEPNPNVYYELGISHALDKSVILCTSQMGQVPFDIRDLNHIVYSDIVDLRGKLAARVGSLFIADGGEK